MASKQYLFQVSSLFFLALIILSLVDINIIPVTAIDFKDVYEEDVHIDSSDSEVKIFFQHHAGNDALFNIKFHLSPNSTNNATLLIEPDDWNVTHIPVAINQTINVTVTNGEVIEPYPNDVASSISLSLQRENVSDEVWGHLIFGVITNGWFPATWPVIPGVLALVLVGALHKRKKR